MRPTYSAGDAVHSSRFCWSVRPWASVKSVKTFRHSSLSSRFRAPARARVDGPGVPAGERRGAAAAFAAAAARRIAEARTARPDARLPFFDIGDSFRGPLREPPGQACYRLAVRKVGRVPSAPRHRLPSRLLRARRAPVKVRFGEFVLDPDSRQLFRDGAEVHLQPKTFELLDLLVRSRPKALSKQAHTGTAVAGHGGGRRQPDRGRGRAAGRPRRRREGAALRPDGLRLRLRLRGEAASPGRRRRSRLAGVAPRVLWEKRIIPLVEGDNVLGRDEDVTVRIDAPGVSRRHALHPGRRATRPRSRTSAARTGPTWGTARRRSPGRRRFPTTPDSASAACSSSSAARPRPARR